MREVVAQHRCAVRGPKPPASLTQTSGGFSTRQWVITAYALALSALLLLGGRVADYWGRKRTYMVGMVGFGIASLWGGLAQTGTELILARGLQGVFAGHRARLRRAFAPHRRGARPERRAARD